MNNDRSRSMFITFMYESGIHKPMNNVQAIFLYHKNHSMNGIHAIPVLMKGATNKVDNLKILDYHNFRTYLPKLCRLRPIIGSTLWSKEFWQSASCQNVPIRMFHLELFPRLEKRRGGGSKMRQASLPKVLQAKLLWLWLKGEWLLLSYPLTQSFSTRYLTPPATSKAVERLFSAAGLIMDARRNKLSPKFVDKLLFLREAYLLDICKLSWK